MASNDPTLAPMVLPVRGALDTAMPVTDRPLGTLVRAIDVSNKWWGPKTGSRAFTRVWEAPGTYAFYDYVTLSGSDTGASAFAREVDFRHLGTKFTVDVIFRLSETAYASGKDVIGLYKFETGPSPGAGVVAIYLRGPNHADAGKLRVEITTTPSEGTADTLVGFTGATAIDVGSSPENVYHARLVRDGKTATLYLNGASDGSTSSLSAVNGVLGSSGAFVKLGRLNATLGSDEVTFKGRIYLAALRDGAFDALPIECAVPEYPMAPCFHHCYLGRSIAMGGAIVHFFDASRFGAHARLDGSSYTVTSAVDNAAPAPAVVQGLRTWTSRGGRTVTAVMCGGALSHAVIS